MATGKTEEQSEVSGNRGRKVQLVLCGFPPKLECGGPPPETLATLPSGPLARWQLRTLEVHP